jgi:HlyD family secretion protein
MRTLTLLMPLLLSPAACQRGGAAKEQLPAPPASVQVARPVRECLVRPIEQPGTIIANQEAPLYAKLPGFVTKYRVDIGDKVKGPTFDASDEHKETRPGDVLAEIAIPELQDEANQKLAQMQQAETELEQSRQLLTIAKQNVIATAALANEARFAVKRTEANLKRWESERLRIAKLVSERTIDPQIGDETTNQFVAAEALHNEAKARIITAEAVARKSEVERDKSEADILVAEAKLQVARAEVQRLHDLLNYTKIRAPFDGVVTQRQIDVKHFVYPPANAKAIPLFTIMNTDVVRVVVEVPEADASIVKTGDDVQLVILKNPPLTAKIARTSGALDPGSRTLRTEIDLPNRDGALKPGTFVNARILAKRPEHWLLPSTAVVKSGDTMVCFLVNGDRAVRTPIQAGRSDGTRIEVFKRLKPGSANAWEDWSGNEVVVSSGTAYLNDGQTIQVASEGKR